MSGRPATATPEQIVIVGASLAGLSAARTLREQQFAGSIVVVGAETDRPYDRPPLSKQILSGRWNPGQAELDSGTLDVTWMLGRRAIALDLAARAVALDGGAPLPFDGLVIANGSAPRTMAGFGVAGIGLAGIHALRTMSDAVALRDAIAVPGARVAIVGAGFIGAEIASVCVDAGIPVTMICRDPAPLSGALGPEVGAALGAQYRAHGVQLRLGATVATLLGDDRVTGLLLSDGSLIEADVVVLAIGVEPATDWLEGSGLQIEDGVVCAATLLAAPGVVAAGDIARWPNGRLGESRRVEHWENAVSMGRHAALTLLGGTAPFETAPWLWSDQFGAKFQLVGSTRGHDEVYIDDALEQTGRLLAVYRRGDRLVAACGIRRSREVLALRDVVGRAASWAPTIESLRTRTEPATTRRGAA